MNDRGEILPFDDVICQSFSGDSLVMWSFVFSSLPCPIGSSKPSLCSAALAFPAAGTQHRFPFLRAPQAEPDLRLVGLSNKKESCSQVEAKPGRVIKAKGAKEFPVLPLPKHFPGCTVVSFLSPKTVCSLKAGSLSLWYFTV